MLHYSKTQDESALLSMAQGGDGNALVELLNHYERQAYRVAFRITHNHEDAEDVLQESHLNAYRRLSQFRGESRFSAWLLKIVARQAVTALRRRSARREVPLENVTDSEDDLGANTFWKTYPQSVCKEPSAAWTLTFRAVFPKNPESANINSAFMPNTLNGRLHFLYSLRSMIQ